jgi:hypothetical protein
MGQRDIFLPSPDEIQQACLKFQETWGHKERRKRDSSQKPQPWTVPIIETAVILQNMAALSSD